MNNSNNIVIENDSSTLLNSSSSFMEANTEAIGIKEIKDKHIIPVFLKDNEPAISQVEFIEVVSEAASEAFNLPFTPDASIRVSHPIKGRVYEARHKKANELLEHEKTIYYERMAFLISLPISDIISGKTLDLTVGGVKAYNLDNLNTSKGSLEHFKVFVGFKNTVCTNLCIATDGYKEDLKVNSSQDLYSQIMKLFSAYNSDNHLEEMKQFTSSELTENQFATLLGKAKLYQYLPKNEKLEIPELLITDTQISRVAENYYQDENFQRGSNGAIDMWRFYNLLTGAVKSSYIDKILERKVNAYEFSKQVQRALNGASEEFWYLN